MKSRKIVAVTLASLFSGAGALADDFPADNVLDVVVVTGKRESLHSAQEIKRSKSEIVDSVVAEDINKLPDFNVSDAMSRITGVQILRDRGEGAGVAIRGLTQMETLLNGREVFTAGNGRTLDFADIPSEMVAGIDVYKTSSANHIEGGVGGTVDLRTRRPFDFSGKVLNASVRSIYGDLIQKNEMQYSMLTSSRWQSESHGEFGALVNASYQKRAWREDQKSTGTPVARTNIISGQTVIAPNGISETTSVGNRERKAAGMVLEWALQDNLKLYAEGNYVEFLTIQDSYQINATAPATFVAGSPVLFPGTNDLQSIIWNNASTTTVGAARDTLDKTSQFAVGGTWKDTALTLKSDLSYTQSYNNLMYSAITLGGTATTLTQDLSSGVPTSSIGGSNLTSLAGFTSAGMWYASRPFDGDQLAAKLDGEYELSAGVVNMLLAGVRVARRRASDAPGQISSFPTAPAVGNASRLVIRNPYGNYLLGDPGAARNAANARATLGITGVLATSNPLGTWGVEEETQAGYAMAKFKALTLPLEGTAGIRAVHTRENVSGNQGPSAGPYTALNIETSSNDYLPSANLRYTLNEGLYLRGAISKTITRQDFNQLSPSLTLNVVQLNGTAGNPSLRPIRADNLDLALEKYFSDNASAYITGFFKRVDGFVLNVSNPEVYSGVTYQVNRPQNINPANIRGAEVGYQQFYENLPQWAQGLGMQANYTYVDSDTPNSTLGSNFPLQNLSKSSYNIIGLYEKGGWSARVAYNWRDRFLSGVANITGVGAVPVYVKEYGWLDASLSYRMRKNLTLSLEGTNLLRTVRSSYYGVETRPQSSWVNDMQVSVTATLGL